MSDDQQKDQEVNQVDEAVRTEALEMGWLDKDQYKGNPDRWVDAETFVEKGKHILPIITKNNERLQGQVNSILLENQKLQEALKDSRESVTALEEYHTEETTRRVEKARKDLLESLKQAKRDQNIDAEVEISEELRQLDLAREPDHRAERADGTGKGEKPSKKNGAAGDPVELSEDFKQWCADNPWFGKDADRTKIAWAVARDLRERGDPLLGRPFMDKVVEETAKTIKRLGGSSIPSRVESSRGGGNGNRAGGKTFSDLPAEAQEACHKFNSRLVGDNRRYKTVGDWEKAYTAKYLEGEAT